ncbi:Protein SAND [Holothuria leucospilota]|uniref:Vacuolar fusion protein MON1 homolog n=1 Tax=Holothuria leucospilota TaxID=206669 RepID=A0A9Q1BSH9_HOLLE|nr:Protein SAND [Holothuria leucospilota]
MATSLHSNQISAGQEHAPGGSQNPVLVTKDSYEELEEDLSLDVDQSRPRHASGVIAEIVESRQHSEVDSNQNNAAVDYPATDQQVKGITADTNHLSLGDGQLTDESEVFVEEEEQRLRSGSVLQTVEKTKPAVVEEDIHSAAWKKHKKHIFILSEAGKPIYSRYGNEDKLVTLMGVIQALMSFVQDDKDSLRSVVAGGHLIVFLLRQPLMLVAASSTGESQQQLFLQLRYMYNQILSVLTHTQLNRIFEQRRNYDLRRLLSGTERFLNSLADLMDSDPCFLLTAVRGLPLDNTVRDVIGQSMQSAKVKDLVFAILIADGQLVTLVHMKKYILHPADLHLVINLLKASTSFETSDSWVPLCLPNFDSSGYLYSHISYLDDSPACLLLMTVDQMAFKEMENCKQKILEKLKKHNCLAAIKDSVKRGSYTCQEVGISELRHFLYKNKSTAQFTAPSWGAPYSDPAEQERLFSLYRFVHQKVHNPARPLKILFYVGSHESALGWITSGFELYAVFSPLTTKQVAILAVNKILKWIKKEEERLFILNPPEY